MQGLPSYLPEHSSGQSQLYGPSGRLPIELLSEIFLLCVDESVDTHNTIEIPLLVASVCSRWRSAAINNPQLWARLFIQLVGIACKSVNAIVDTWLARSAGCPLTIYVFWGEAPFADTHIVLEKLIDHSERWQTMFFYLPYRAFKSFTRVRNRLPTLAELSLGTDPDSIASSAPTPNLIGPSNQFDMFENAPRLRSLECVNFSPTHLRFPWAQLEDIPLVSGNIEDCLDILHRGKRLAKISMIFVEGGTLPWTPLHPAFPLNIGGGGGNHYPFVCHHFLTCLTIMTPPWNEFVDLGMLFPRLALPNLETLTVCNLWSAFGEEFTEFLSRLPTLKTLHLRKTALSDDQLVDCLKHLSSLTNLIVLSQAAEILNAADGTYSEPTVTRYLLEALTRNFFSNDATDGMLLPRLQKLELTVGSAAVRELDTFIDMLQSRLRDDDGLARLEHVRVRPSVDLDDEFMIRLIELRDYGLDVQVENM